MILDAKVFRAVWESARREDLRSVSCRRAAFRVEVKPWLYDAFFNSSVGYRAQYAVSALRGEEKNWELLNALSPGLVAHAGDLLSDLPSVAKSLAGAGAKVWIDEDEVAPQLDGPPEIAYQPWIATIRARGDGITAGLRAPVGTLLVVYGEWLDHFGAFHADPHKLSRAQEIHDVGWT
jgi:hypothetical protein